MLVSLLAASIAASAQGTVLIRFLPPVGQTLRYRTTTDFDQSGQGVAMKYRQVILSTIKVVSRRNGATTLETTTLSSKLDLPKGSPLESARKAMESGATGIRVRTVVDATGSVREVRVVSSGKANAAAQAMQKGIAQASPGGVQGVSLPKGPVRVGQTWNSTIDIGKMLGQALAAAGPGTSIRGVIPIRTTLNGLKKIGTLTLADIGFRLAGTTSITAQGRSMSFRMSGSGTGSFDVATGTATMVKSTMVNDMKMNGMALRQKITSTMRRL